MLITFTRVNEYGAQSGKFKKKFNTLNEIANFIIKSYRKDIPSNFWCIPRYSVLLYDGLTKKQMFKLVEIVDSKLKSITKNI